MNQKNRNVKTSLLGLWSLKTRTEIIVNALSTIIYPYKATDSILYQEQEWVLKFEVIPNQVQQQQFLVGLTSHPHLLTAKWLPP